MSRIECKKNNNDFGFDYFFSFSIDSFISVSAHFFNIGFRGYFNVRVPSLRTCVLN